MITFRRNRSRSRARPRVRAKPKTRARARAIPTPSSRPRTRVSPVAKQAARRPIQRGRTPIPRKPNYTGPQAQAKPTYQPDRRPVIKGGARLPYEPTETPTVNRNQYSARTQSYLDRSAARGNRFQLRAAPSQRYAIPAPTSRGYNPEKGDFLDYADMIPIKKWIQSLRPGDPFLKGNVHGWQYPDIRYDTGGVYDDLGNWWDFGQQSSGYGGGGSYPNYPSYGGGYGGGTTPYKPKEPLINTYNPLINWNVR